MGHWDLFRATLETSQEEAPPVPTFEEPTPAGGPDSPDEGDLPTEPVDVATTWAAETGAGPEWARPSWRDEVRTPAGDAPWLADGSSEHPPVEGAPPSDSSDPQATDLCVAGTGPPATDLYDTGSEALAAGEVAPGPEFLLPDLPDDGSGAPPRAGSRRPVAMVMLVVACMLATGLLGGVIGARIGDDDDFRPAALPPISPRTTERVSSPGSIADVVDRVSPSVVGIRSRGLRLGVGQGTGFILSAEGDIVTNSHVINGAKTILVTLPGEDQARDAEVIGNDEDEDLAVLRLSGVTGLPAVELGDSDALRLGEEVFAIGHALGLAGGPSVSRGVVSGLQRANGPLAELIQTDAALNPGNSGGPLFDSEGRVIGVNTMVRAGAENIGFAIPMGRVRTIVDRLREGRPAPPVAFLGVRTQPAEDGAPGAEIVDVTPGTPAQKAGLAADDRIVAVDGKRVSGPESLAGLIRGKNPGDEVEIRYRRGDEEETVTVALATKDDAN